VSTLPALLLVLGWLTGLPLYTDERGAQWVSCSEASAYNARL